jgi:YD repeat-containing protein
MDITQQKGLTTEIRCILDFTELGYRCLTPVDDSSKYDVVVDLNGKFLKIQCKTSSWVADTIQEKVAFSISTCCQTTNTKKTTQHKYSADEIDYFYTWFNGQGYLVSINEATGTKFRWRYEYPSSGQKQGIHIADNYKIEEVIKRII